MKVLIATPLYPPDDGGPATRAKTLESALPTQGIEVVLRSFSRYRHMPKGISHLSYFFSLYRAAKGVDIIYTLDLVSVGLPALIVSKITGIPLMLSMVGDYAWEQGVQRAGVKENLDEFVRKSDYPFMVRLFRKIQTAVAYHATRIITPSHYLKSILGLWGIEQKKIVVVYNSFNADLPKGSKEQLRKELGMNSPTVISVGRFVPWKGFKVLMDVVAEVKKNVPDVVLEIAGSGDNSEYVAYAENHGYHFAKFLGLLEHNALMKRIRAADCFALNTGYEGLSYLILETMALETPVVTTDVGGNPELFPAERKHWLAHYNEKDHLAALISTALLDKHGSAKDAKNSALFVAEFTEERMIKETIAVMNDIAP